MTDTERSLMEAGEAAVERAKAKSKQPRFIEPAEFFGSVYWWARRAELEEPVWKADSKKRDEWLRQFWRRETHLAGVLNSVVSIDKNRGWSLTGGRNQVLRYTPVLGSAEGGAGWRRFTSRNALAYYAADIGAPTELGRLGKRGPVRALWSVDPARCQMTGKPKTPLKYFPKGPGKQQEWDPWDFFRSVSMESNDEGMKGVGFCAVSRALELAKLMIAVYQHDQEELGSMAPKGLMILKGISEQQWNDRMDTRKEMLQGESMDYYGGVDVLATEGFEDVGVTLVALSKLPAGFDIEVTTNLLMYGYALTFGYPPSEFWPVAAGALGRGREEEIGQRRATTKGGMDYALAFADGLTHPDNWPETLLFEFEERDAEGDRLEADVADAWVEVATKLYESGAPAAPLLERQQALSLLAEHGVIPPEWSEIAEEAEATDVEPAGEEEPVTEEEEPVPETEEAARALQTEPVQRALDEFPDEPIVRYSWPSGTLRVLWDRNRVKRRWAGFRARQDESDVLYQGDDFQITEADVDRSIEQYDRDMPEEARGLLVAEETEERSGLRASIAAKLGL